MTDCLSGNPSIPSGDPRLPHGRLLANTCLETPKDGRDREAMLDYKVRRLADLMRLSKKTMLYIDATTTTADGFDSKTAITACEVEMESYRDLIYVKPIFQETAESTGVPRLALFAHLKESVCKHCFS